MITSTLRQSPLPHSAFALLFALSGAACGDDTASGGNGGAGAGGASGNGASASGAGDVGGATNGGGGAGSAGGAQGGNGQGGNGQPGFPWEGAIDPNGGPASGRLIRHEQGTTSAPQGFYEYAPAGYPGQAQWPLLIALHGIGENGNGTTDLGNVINVGIGNLIKNDNWPNDRPYVVLIPQHPGGGCPGADEIQSFIAWGIQNYEIDPRYVYLTGLSCGAIGSWSYLQQHLDTQIAAFVPVAGDGAGAWGAKGCELGSVAIWAFHGDADGTVNVSGTNIPMDGLATCPSPPALENKKTIYPGVGHNSWDMTYDLSAGHDIYTWMLGFTHQP